MPDCVRHRSHLPRLLAALIAGLPATASAEGSGTVELVMGGDVMLAEAPGEVIARGGDPFAAIAGWLPSGAIRVANLECVVAEGGRAEDKPYTFRASPAVLPVLRRHFDAVSVANNHSGDFGKAAFAEQLGLLRTAGLPWFGGGLDLAQAHQPWIIERNGLRIAFLGYVEFKPRSFEAQPDRPGVAWGGEDEQVLRDIEAARRVHGADLVVPFMHWGWENETYTSPRQRDFARRMVDAGASLVVGTHPHVTQGAEVHRGVPIIPSLGNLVFNGFDTPETTTGWLLQATLDARGVARWRIRGVTLDAEGSPHPLDVAAPCGARDDPEVRLCGGP